MCATSPHICALIWNVKQGNTQTRSNNIPSVWLQVVQSGNASKASITPHTEPCMQKTMINDPEPVWIVNQWGSHRARVIRRRYTQIQILLHTNTDTITHKYRYYYTQIKILLHTNTDTITH